MAIRFNGWALGLGLARKYLPHLIPILLSMLAQYRDLKPQTESRSGEFKEALEHVAARLAYVERRMKQALVLVILSFLFSVGALIIVFTR